MPYCESCERFYSPNTLTAAGDCPDGHHVADPEPEPERPKAPWHFKVLVGFAVLYLAWRLLQAIAWGIDALL